jgi:hypothetical protein
MNNSYKLAKYKYKLVNSEENSKPYCDKIIFYSQNGGKSIFKLPKFNVGDNVKWTDYGVEMFGTVISKLKNKKYKIMTFDNAVMKVSEKILEQITSIKIQKLKIGDTVSWIFMNMEIHGTIISILDSDDNYSVLADDGNIIKVPKSLLKKRILKIESKFKIGETVKWKIFNIEHIGVIISDLDDDLNHRVMQNNNLIISLPEYSLEKVVSFSGQQFTIGDKVKTNYNGMQIIGNIISNMNDDGKYKINTYGGTIIMVHENLLTKVNDILDTVTLSKTVISSNTHNYIETKKIPLPIIQNNTNLNIKDININNMETTKSSDSQPNYTLKSPGQKYDYQLFYPGDRVANFYDEKTGTIKSFRNDKTEQQYRVSDKYHYYYDVEYDDGTFETYEPQHNLYKI